MAASIASPAPTRGLSTRCTGQTRAMAKAAKANGASMAWAAPAAARRRTEAATQAAVRAPPPPPPPASGGDAPAPVALTASRSRWPPCRRS